MEKEVFLSGYCRTIDESCMVAVVLEDGKMVEVDCCYENCIHTPGCVIAKEIRQLIQEERK